MPVVTMHWDNHKVHSDLDLYALMNLRTEFARILAEEFGLGQDRVRVYNHDCGHCDITLRPLSIDINISAGRLGQTEFNLMARKVFDRVRELLPADMVGKDFVSILFNPMGGAEVMRPIAKTI